MLSAAHCFRVIRSESESESKSEAIRNPDLTRPDLTRPDPFFFSPFARGQLISLPQLQTAREDEAKDESMTNDHNRPEHAGQWADACAGCAADRKASA